MATAEQIIASDTLIDRATRLCVTEFADHFTEGSIRAWLELAAKNHGLIVLPAAQPKFLFAFLRYHPSHMKALYDQDFAVLEELDLSRGPILHVLAYVCPEGGYHSIRDLFRFLDPWGITFHRYVKRTGEWRFGTLINHEYRRDKNHGLIR